MQFYQLAPGARFEYYGQEFTKTAMSMAWGQGFAHVFYGSCEVKPIGEPLLLPEAEAQKWKPIDIKHWADHLAPAPGQTQAL